MAGFKTFFLVCIIILAVLAIACLIRAILGPRIADRFVAVNMIGTMTMAIIAILSVYLHESTVLDICLIYAVMSFVAVIVFAKIYIGLYNERKAHESERKRRRKKGEERHEC